jgi:hypothetical protein
VGVVVIEGTVYSGGSNAATCGQLATRRRRLSGSNVRKRERQMRGLLLLLLLLLLCESIVNNHAGNEGIEEDVSNRMGGVKVREK